MDILGQSSLLVGVTSFALGFSVLARNVRNKLYLAFTVLTTLISGWALAFFLEKIWGGGSFYRVHLFLNIWLTPAALAFIRVMIRIRDRFSRRLLDLSFALAFFLSVALILHLESNPLLRGLIYFSPGLVVVQTLALMWIDRRLRLGLARIPKRPTVGFGRRNLIYLGGLIVLATSVMDHVPWMGKVIPSFGNIALTVYLFFLSQAISQLRLLNFAALASRFLVLLGLALTLTGVYSLLVGWIQNSPSLFFLNSFVASFLVLMLLDPLRTLVGYFTQRLLTQKHRRLVEIIRESQRKLAGIVDPGSLFQAILQTVEQTLQPEWTALFVLRSDGTKYRRVRTLDHEENPSDIREVLADHPLLEACKVLHSRGDLPILLDQILENEMDRSTTRNQHERFEGLIQGLKALGATLLIPLTDLNRILGFVTVRVPGPPEPWGSNWGLLPIIYPYFEQAAQTLKNMEVFVRQREKERLAALGEMAAGLAHEIRNPLGAIKGAAQYLDPAGGRPESQFLKIIVDEVDRLNHVVSQFLDYSKPPNADFKRIDISELVRKMSETFRSTLDSKIRLEFERSTSPAYVECSPEQIQQVLLNLLQNSVKAIGARSDGLIRVFAEKQGNGAGSEIHIVVEDTGSGIKREHLDKLFIPFFTTSPSGTGLGLSISQKIVESHRGRIEVATEEGKFSRFSVVLPCIKE